VEASDSLGLSSDEVVAIGSVFERDADFVRKVANGFKKAERTLESRVQGWSMGKTLPDGARIRIRCSPREAYPRGEVVAFLNEGKIVVHRVIRTGRGRRGRSYLLTRGDSLLLPDYPVHNTSVLGPVIAFQSSEAWQSPREGVPRPAGKRLLSAIAVGLVGAALDVDVRLGRLCTWGLWECQRWLYRIESTVGRLEELL
jgi:Peptidase S24-like